MRVVVVVLVLFTASVAWARPMVTVHTKDGGTVHGELIERVVDDHVTVLLETGIVKRIESKDVEPHPPSTQDYVETEPGPIETVRTSDGSVYHGALIESVPGDHVTLRLEAGEIHVARWEDIIHGPPPSPRVSTREPAPLETLHTVMGRHVKGELIEKVVRDHVTLLLTSGAIRTFKWNAIDWSDEEKPSGVMIDFKASPGERVSLERISTSDGAFAPVCESPCIRRQPPSKYRVAGEDITTSKPFVLREDSRVVVASGSRNVHTLGALLIVIGSLSLTAGVPLALGALTANSFQDNTGIGSAAVLSNLGGLVSLITGVALMVASGTTVTVNPR